MKRIDCLNIRVIIDSESPQTPTHQRIVSIEYPSDLYRSPSGMLGVSIYQDAVKFELVNCRSEQVK